MTTFSNEYIHFVGIACITPWTLFDSDLAEFLIFGEL
jgi:hypothetical protein